jgi:hypothetical protein
MGLYNAIKKALEADIEAILVRLEAFEITDADIDKTFKLIVNTAISEPCRFLMPLHLLKSVVKMRFLNLTFDPSTTLKPYGIIYQVDEATGRYEQVLPDISPFIALPTEIRFTPRGHVLFEAGGSANMHAHLVFDKENKLESIATDIVGDLTSIALQNSWNTDEYNYYSTNSTTEIELAKIDLGAVHIFERLFIHHDVWVNPQGVTPGTGDYIKAQYSEDGVTWTDIYNLWGRTESDRVVANQVGNWYHYVDNVTLRYLRIVGKVSDATNTIHTAIYKIFAF